MKLSLRENIRRHRRTLAGGLVAIAVIVVGSAWLVSTPSFPLWLGFNGKTFWDVISVALIPLAVVVVGFIFSRREKQVELQIARDREEAAALQTYYDRMSELLLTHKLRESVAGAESRSVARALTLSTLRRLTNERKGRLLRFLAESGLITEPAVIDLEDADLHKANLLQAKLVRANLVGVDLIEAGLILAELRGAVLRRSYLYGALLQRANLQGADLRDVNFQMADLRAADLHGANLCGADLTGASFDRANFRGAIFDSHTVGLPPDITALMVPAPQLESPAPARIQLAHAEPPPSLPTVDEAPVADPAPAPAAPPAGRQRRARAKG